MNEKVEAGLFESWLPRTARHDWKTLKGKKLQERRLHRPVEKQLEIVSQRAKVQVQTGDV